MATTYLTIGGALAFGAKAIKTFSDLEEQTNKFNVVFAGMGEQSKQILDELKDGFGQSELSAKRMLSSTGDLLTGFGFARDSALDLAEASAKLGADLASYNDYAGGAVGASEALTKAMLGEAEGVKSLGIVIRQDSEEYKTLIAQAQTTGVYIEALGKTFTASSVTQAKAIAAIATAYQQSKNAIGDYARSQDSIANKQKTIANSIQESYSKIGGDNSGLYSDALSGVNALLKGYNNLNDSTRQLLNNTILTTAGLIALSKVGTLTALNTSLSKTVAYLSAGHNATELLATSVTKAKGAFTALNTALGPVGWTLLAVGGIYMTYTHIVEKNRRELSSQTSATRDNTEAMLAQAQANAKQREQAVQYLTKLEELSRYEVLHKNTQEEALKMVEELTKKYGDLGIKIDENTGKLKIEADAWAKLSEKQAQEVARDNLKNLNANNAETTALENNLRNEARSIFKDNIYRQAEAKKRVMWGMTDGKTDEEFTNSYLSTDNQLEIDRIQKLNDIDEKIKAYEDLKNTFYNESDEENAQRVKDIIANLEKAKKYKKLNDEYLDNKKNKVKTPTLSPTEEPLNNQNELNQYRTVMWNMQFDEADTVQKVQMLSSKINSVFQGQSGKFGNLGAFMTSDTSKMTASELKDLQKIVELEKQRYDIAKAHIEERQKESQQRLIDNLAMIEGQQSAIGARSVTELNAQIGYTTDYEQETARNTKEIASLMRYQLNNGGLTY